MGQLKLFISLAMTVLFTIAIITFVGLFGTDNDSAVLLSQDETYDNVNTNLNTGIQDFQDDSDTSLNTLMSTTQDQGDQSATSGGQFKVGIFTIVTQTKTVLDVGFKSIFGEDTGFGIFLTALLTIFTIMFAAYAWKTWRGNPD